MLKLLAFLLTSFPLVASAATFNVLCDNGLEHASRSCTIHMNGKIEKGDAARLRSVLQKKLPDSLIYGKILLDSPGGDVHAAVEIADVVRKSLLATTTFRLPKDIRKIEPAYKLSAKCVSACFLIWVAGTDRDTLIESHASSTKSDIGLHRPYLDKRAYEGPPQEIARLQQEAMSFAANYLMREQIPQALIEKMLQRASTQIYWLTEEDSDITGRSPWFEEMMIARCGYDPTYDRESQHLGVEAIEERARQRLAGKKNLPPIDFGARYDEYIKWRQQYNSCEYETRASAQQALRQ